MRKLILTAAIAPLLAAGLTGCATTDIAKSANMINKARKVQKTAATVEQVTGQDMGMVSDPLNMQGRADAKAAAQMTADAQLLADAAPISAQPMAITTFRKMSGKTKALSMQPKVAVAGYNVAALTEGQVSGTASGDLLGYSQGSSTTIKLSTSGISPAMVQRISDAASEDLIAQLQAAGFQVVEPSAVALAPNAKVMKAGQALQEKKIYSSEGAKMTAIVAGPTGYGYRQGLSGLPERGFGAGMNSFAGNGPGKLSGDLGAIVVTPTLILDFAKLKASRARLTSRSSASANLGFSIDPQSSFVVNASKSGRYVDAFATYGVKKPVVADAPFAMMGEKDTSSNMLEQGLGRALGMATRAKKTTNQAVIIDSDRYEALALSAARGWNAAFVAQLTAARTSTS